MTDSMAMGGMAAIWPMAGMGLITSVLAPALVLATRAWPRCSGLTRPLSWPAPVALIGFVLLHGAITIGLDVHPVSTAASIAAHLLLLIGAVAFWLPVLGDARNRLDAGAGTIYLFLGAPALDLAGVAVVAWGDDAGGLAMIVAMLPIGLTALALAWRWISGEETAARAADADASVRLTRTASTTAAPKH
jgi:hypothetical protein